jgi:hypothetical protein
MKTCLRNRNIVRNTVTRKPQYHVVIGGGEENTITALVNPEVLANHVCDN